MIAAPGFGVVLEHASRGFSYGGIPGRAVAFRVANDEIRRGLDIRTLIYAAGSLHIGDGNLAGLFVGKASKLLDQFLSKPFGFCLRNHALRFTPFSVEI